MMKKVRQLCLNTVPNIALKTILTPSSKSLLISTEVLSTPMKGRKNKSSEIKCTDATKLDFKKSKKLLTV